MSAHKVVPLLLFCGAALALVLVKAKGKTNEVFEGVVVEENLRYEFYPGATDCGLSARSYWLVPNEKLNQAIPNSSADIEGLFHKKWRIKFRGDLSRLGWYGYRGAYWREISARSVIDSQPLYCDQMPKNYTRH